jgi:hypothetical protein
VAQKYTSGHIPQRFAKKNALFYWAFHAMLAFERDYPQICTSYFRFQLSSSMKNSARLFLFAFLAAALLFGTSACNRGTGCPMNESAHVQPDKKGNYPRSKTKSGLFPKGVYKRRG